MANVYAQILKAGLQSSYNALETRDSNVLYFCTDTGKIYKGDVDFSNNVVVAATKPEAPLAGKIYVLADTNTVEVYVSGAWKVISYPTVTTIDANSDDNHIGTAKAVYDAIQAAIESLASSENTVKGIEAGTTDGTIKVTKGDDSTVDVTVPGVVTTPVWDATARKLTLPVTGSTAVEVEIGKDIFIDPSAENKYNPETGNIELYLNDGAGGEATMISIPASALVDVYTGGTSTSATTTVGDDNVVTVAVKLDTAEGNAITVVEGENGGLRVDLSAYAKTADVEATTSALQTAVEAAQGDATAANAAIEVLNADAQTEGSVDNKVATTKAALTLDINAVADRVTTLEGEMDTAQADIVTNKENIDALAAAFTWGTF